MTHKIAYLKAFFIVQIGRLLLLLPDALIVRILGFAAGLAGFFGAAPGTRTNIGEARAIFVKGGPGPEIVRRMLSEGDPRRLRMIIRGSMMK